MILKNPNLKFPLISDIDIGYVAGFYDGEGSCIHNKDKETCHVSITQKDPEPLVRLQKLFGGEIKPYGGYNYWRIYGDEAKIFFLMIFDHLSDRRKEQILRFEKYLTSGDLCPNGHEYTEGSYKILKDETRNREYRSCSICAREKKQRHNEPMNQAALAISGALKITKEEALEFLAKESSKQERIQ